MILETNICLSASFGTNEAAKSSRFRDSAIYISRYTWELF